MTKLFKVVGVSLHNGKWSVRYANSLGRSAVLVRNGHEAVKLYKLADALAKEDCVDYLLTKKWDIANKAAFAAVKNEAVKLGFLL